MREGSRSRDPSPSTSIPTWITRTSCIRSAAVCRSASVSPMIVRGAAASCPSVLPMMPSPFWSMLRPPAGKVTGAGRRVHRERAERAEAVADDVDGDGGDPVRRHGWPPRAAVPRSCGRWCRGRRSPPATRPPASGPGRQEQVEVDLVDALDDRRPGAGPDRRDVLARVDQVVGREVLAERDRAHRAGDGTEELDGNSDGAERPGHTRLLVEGDAAHLVQVEHRPRPARPQEEVGRRRGGGVDLVADLLQRRRGAHGREDARRHDVLRQPRHCRRPRRRRAGPSGTPSGRDRASVRS